MPRALIAALLSGLAWPGAGQFFNRDFKKGILLTGLTVLLAVSLMLGLGRDLARVMPQSPSPLDPDQVRALRDAMLSANPAFYKRYSLLLSLTWLFGVVDAWLGAREKAAPPPAPPPPPDAPAA